MEISTRRLVVDDPSAVGEARRIVGSLAGKLGFDAVDVGRVNIVASELASNIVKHAGRGVFLATPFECEAGVGVEILALDNGPGILDADKAFEDGFSTAGTSGSGLGAVRRQSQTCELYSKPGQGAAILARLVSGGVRRGAAPAPNVGGVSVAKTGEEACGDGWTVKKREDRISILVADGLGHGPLAATASAEALRAFAQGDGRASADEMQRLHMALRPTRGAAASIVELPLQSDQLHFVGVGNVAGAYVNDRETRRMVSYNGTLGHSVRAVRPFSYVSAGETLVILATDGLGTNWTLDPYRGLRDADPTLIAGVLYRDFDRGRDDVTVVVARRTDQTRSVR